MSIFSKYGHYQKVRPPLEAAWPALSFAPFLAAGAKKRSAGNRQAAEPLSCCLFCPAQANLICALGSGVRC